MSLVNQDRVLEKSTTTGTGAYTLAGNPGITGFNANDYQTFAAIGDGNTCQYVAYGVDPATGIPSNAGWEVGLGTYTASGTTLARTAIYASSNSGSAVSWSAGTRFIMVTQPAEGALVIRQPGGTVGDDQGEIDHDGTNLNITNRSAGQSVYCAVSSGSDGGSLRVTRVDATSRYIELIPSFIVGGGAINSHAGILIQPGGGTAELTIRSTNLIFYTSGYSLLGAIWPVAANVFGANNASGGPAWFQNSAGVSRVNSDVTNNTATLANITGLSSTLIAGRKYSGRIVVYCDDSTSVDGIKFDFDGGSATMTSFQCFYVVLDTTAAAPIASGRTAAIATDITVATLVGNATAIFDVAFVCNGGGTFIPRMSQNSHTAGTATVSLGSNMILNDIP